MGATLAALEKRGLIGRSPDPNDGRCVVLALTESGLAALSERRRARVDQLAQGLAGFSTAELEQLHAAAPLIERLAQRL